MPIQANQQDSFFGANFHHLATKKIQCNWYKGFLWKNAPKVATLWRKKFQNHHSYITCIHSYLYNNEKTSQFTGTGAAHRQFAVHNPSKTFNISWTIYTHNIPSLKFLSKYNSGQSQSPERSTIFVSKADTSLVQNQVHDEDDDDDDDADLARALNPKWRKSM
jgi:hypothetical protein